MKKRFTLLFIMIMVLLAVCTSVAAEEAGTCGENLTWILSDNGTLTISGTGEMESYQYGTPPWKGDIFNPSNENVKKIEEIIIESGVTTIGDYAFSGLTNVKTIHIPETVTSIGVQAFGKCDNLTKIFIPESVAEIKPAAFSEWSSQLVVHGNNNNYIFEDGCLYSKDKSILHTYFGNKEYTSFAVPDNVIKIENYAFENNNTLTNLKLSDSVTSIGEYAFSQCSSLKSITLNNTLSIIGAGAFYSCRNLESIMIPDSVTEIGFCAFQTCENLQRIKLSRNMTSLSEGMFAHCSGLTEVAIPHGITKIDGTAFLFCSNLRSITIPETVLGINTGAFDGCNNLIIVNYAKGQYEWNSINIEETGNQALINAEKQFYTPEITVSVDGVLVDFDVIPYVENERTLVPMRAIFEKIGATVEWDENTQNITSTKDSKVVVLTLGSTNMMVDDTLVELDVPAKAINGRTFVPVRAVSEAFDCNVQWDDETKTVIITNNNK